MLAEFLLLLLLLSCVSMTPFHPISYNSKNNIAGILLLFEKQEAGHWSNNYVKETNKDTKISGKKTSIPDFSCFFGLGHYSGTLKKCVICFLSLIKWPCRWELTLKLSTGSLTSVSAAVNNNFFLKQKKQQKSRFRSRKCWASTHVRVPEFDISFLFCVDEWNFF